MGEARRLTPYQEALAADGHCMADDDDDCTWEECPQLLDGKIRNHSSRRLPLALRWMSI